MRKKSLKKLEEKSIKEISLLNLIKGGDDDNGSGDKKKIKVPSNQDNPDDEVTSDE